MDLKGPDFSDSRDLIFSNFRDLMIISLILRTRIGSLKHLKKTLVYPFNFCVCFL